MSVGTVPFLYSVSKKMTTVSASFSDPAGVAVYTRQLRGFLSDFTSPSKLWGCSPEKRTFVLE